VARFRLRATNAGRVADELLSLADEAARGGPEAAREIARDAVSAYRVAAPRRTGNLRRGIGTAAEIRGGREVITVGGDARDPLTGYDYFDVTRFGHRVARIYPRLDRAPATVLATRRARATNTFSPIHGVRGNAALRFVIGGRVLYRRWTRGYHPARDWAENADPAIESAADEAERRLAERLS
jgi:hypothetical protein